MHLNIAVRGCKTWILTEKRIEKLYIYARTCYRIMLVIKTIQSPRVQPKSVPTYVSLRETIRERQIKFKVHCIRMPKVEPAKRFVIYESRIKLSLRPGAPKTTYLNQISSHILQSGEKSLEAGKMAANKSEWS